MQIQDVLTDAIDAVLAWGLSDEAFTEAVQEQARLMAGLLAE